MTQDEVDKYCESVATSLRALSCRKPRYGVGINDLPHITQFDDAEGKRRVHSGYSQWAGVMARCYSDKFKLKQPTYRDVVSCEDWKYASKFMTWQKIQYRKGWHLDKDLLVAGSKVYSPETCIYVPRWLNNFTTDGGGRRGEYLIGVNWHKATGRYVAQCQNPFKEKQDHIGLFASELEAHLAWRERKLEFALELKPKMDTIDTRIYPNVVTIVNNAK
jgi:hypothetical protein